MKWSKRARRYDGCSLCNYCPCHEHCSLRERWERAGKRNSEMKAAIVRWRRRLSLASSPLEIWLRELHFHMQAHPACIYYKDPASSPRVFLFSLLFSFLLSRTSCFRQCFFPRYVFCHYSVHPLDSPPWRSLRRLPSLVEWFSGHLPSSSIPSLFAMNINNASRLFSSTPHCDTSQGILYIWSGVTMLFRCLLVGHFMDDCICTDNFGSYQLTISNDSFAVNYVQWWIFSDVTETTTC